MPNPAPQQQQQHAQSLPPTNHSLSHSQKTIASESHQATPGPNLPAALTARHLAVPAHHELAINGAQTDAFVLGDGRSRRGQRARHVRPGDDDDVRPRARSRFLVVAPPLRADASADAIAMDMPVVLVVVVVDVVRSRGGEMEASALSPVHLGGESDGGECFCDYLVWLEGWTGGGGMWRGAGFGVQGRVVEELVELEFLGMLFLLRRIGRAGRRFLCGAVRIVALSRSGRRWSGITNQLVHRF